MAKIVKYISFLSNGDVVFKETELSMKKTELCFPSGPINCSLCGKHSDQEALRSPYFVKVNEYGFILYYNEDFHGDSCSEK